LEVGTAPAIAVAITDSDRTIATRTYGAATSDALCPVASIGKSFTAVIALQLAEEGRLELHVPVTDYVPWLTIGSRSASITLHHLLTHTGGIVESSDLAPASTYDVIALAEAATGFMPGEHRWYSNIGYRAVGVVLEAVTGEPYGELLQRRVLDRLGLRDSVAVMTHETRRRLPSLRRPSTPTRYLNCTTSYVSGAASTSAPRGERHAEPYDPSTHEGRVNLVLEKIAGYARAPRSRLAWIAAPSRAAAPLPRLSSEWWRRL
jgi:CubicO group peptidase (beta-lactamase class C family)